MAIYDCMWCLHVYAEVDRTQKYMAEDTGLQELFKKVFDGIQDKLVDELDVESGLWTKLAAKKVLVGRQIRTCLMKV